jgi:hypothetical protein
MKESLAFMALALTYALWVFSDAVGRFVLRLLTSQPSIH